MKAFFSHIIEVWFWNVYGNLGSYGDPFSLPLKVTHWRVASVWKGWGVGIMLIMEVHKGKTWYYIVSCCFPVLRTMPDTALSLNKYLNEWILCTLTSLRKEEIVRLPAAIVSTGGVFFGCFLLLAWEYQVPSGWTPLISIMNNPVHDKRSCLYTAHTFGENRW